MEPEVSAISLPTSNPNKTSGHASESLVSPALLPKHCGQNRELRPKFNVRRVFKSYSVITGSMCKPKMDTPLQKPWGGCLKTVTTLAPGLARQHSAVPYLPGLNRRLGSRGITERVNMLPGGGLRTSLADKDRASE